MEISLWFFNTRMGLIRKMETDFLSRACSDGTRGNGFKSEEDWSIVPSLLIGTRVYARFTLKSRKRCKAFPRIPV